MNAITLLKNDHRSVEKLFKRFEKAGDRAFVAKREIVEKIVEELSVHAAIEEQVFYPAVRLEVDGVEDLTLESLEEHHVVKWILSELDSMAPEDERYVAKATVLIENVRHHVEEEEGDLFPKVVRDLSSRQLDDLGDRLARAKELAPKRPHPRSPDTPPANLVTGPAAALADRATGAVRDLARSAIDRVTGGADDLADEVSDLADAAASKATSAGRDVKEHASRSTRSATKKAARRTSASATRAAGAATSSKAKTKAKASARSTSSGSTRPTTSAKAGRRASGAASKARRTTKKAASSR